MRVFQLFELVIICAFLYLAANLLRYFFFRESYGGGMFSLSDKWLKDDTKKEKKK